MKKLLILLLLLTSPAFAGIPLSSQFDLSAQLPLDSRIVVADTTARDAIPTVERFEGLAVYITADETTYQLQGGITNSDWVEFGAGGGDVFGPSSSVSGSVVEFNGTTGKLIADSGILSSNLATASANLDDNYIVRGDGGAKGIQTSLVKIDDTGYVRTPIAGGYYVSPNTNPDSSGGVRYGIATSEEAFIDAVSLQIKGTGSSAATLKIGTTGVTNANTVYLTTELGNVGSGPYIIFSNNKINFASKIQHSGNVMQRVVTIGDATSITPNVDTTDIGKQLNTQAAGTLTINAPTGTPDDGQEYVFRIYSSNAQTFSWNAIYSGGIVSLPTATTGGGKTDYFKFIYHLVDDKWNFLQANYGF